MPRHKLRSLLVVLALGPPVLAGAGFAMRAMFWLQISWSWPD